MSVIKAIPPEDGKCCLMRRGRVTWLIDGHWSPTSPKSPYDLIAEYTGNAEPWTVPNNGVEGEQLAAKDAAI